MVNWRDSSAATTLQIVFFVGVPVLGLTIVLLTVLDPSSKEIPREDLVIGSGLASLFAIAFGWGTWIRRRGTASLGEPGRTALAKAIRTGEPPQDPTLDRPMLTAIQKRRQATRWSRAFLAVGILAYGLMFAMGAGPGESHPATSGIVVACLACSWWQAEQFLSRLSRLEEALQARLGSR